MVGTCWDLVSALCLTEGGNVVDWKLGSALEDKCFGSLYWKRPDCKWWSPGFKECEKLQGVLQGC